MRALPPLLPAAVVVAAAAEPLRPEGLGEGVRMVVVRVAVSCSDERVRCEGQDQSAGCADRASRTGASFAFNAQGATDDD